MSENMNNHKQILVTASRGFNVEASVWEWNFATLSQELSADFDQALEYAKEQAARHTP